MRVKEKKIDETTVQLNATATAAEVDSAFETVERGLAQRLGLMPDPTKTAAQAIQEKLQISDADSVLDSQAMEELVPYAIDARNIIPANSPSPEYDTKISRGRPWAFRVKVKLKPRYTLTSYGPVEIRVPRFTFDDAQVERQLQEVTHQYPEFVVDDPRPVGPHDVCAIALHATKDGEEVKGLSTERRTLSLGEGYMPEDFEKNVIGMQPGETKEFSFDAPNWDPDSDAPEHYEAKVTVLEIQKEIMPDLTDEWVASHLPMYRGVEDLRNNLHREMEKAARHQYDLQVATIAQTELATRFEGKVPDEAYESTAASIKNTLAMQLRQQGETLDRFIEEQGGEQAFNIGLMMQARQTIRCDYSLDALFDHENLQVSEDDVMDACAELNPQNPLGVRQHMEQHGRKFALREIAQRYAASRYLVEHAKITYEEDGEQG